MGFELKKLSADAIPMALDRADRYRLLNEPAEAESICLDVLEVDPKNQKALVTLILAITDQYDRAEFRVNDGFAGDLLPRLDDEYARAYYAGVIAERRAKATLGNRMPGTAAYQLLREAMHWYEKAEALRPAGNDEALLRWNTCARLIDKNASIRPEEPEERVEPYLE
jgi:hypothetical protein